MASLAPASSQAELDEFLSTAAGSIDDVGEVVTDPATLWPWSVLYDRTIKFTAEGETGVVSERRVSTLDWDSSDCL